MSAGYFPTEKWAVWGRNFESIDKELMSLGVKRLIHKAHLEVLNSYEVEYGTGVVHQWMQENYADSMLMGLRRVIDKNRRTFSLITLLEEIKDNRSEITFDGYAELCRNAKGYYDEAFLRILFARLSSDGCSLDGDRIEADIKKLRDDNVAIRDYIDTVIAHREKGDGNEPRGGHGSEVTWGDLDRLFEDVAALFNKYNQLVNPGMHVDFEPVLPAGFQRAFERMMVGK